MDQYTVAIHEAGHTVMAAILQKEIDLVTIIPVNNVLGGCYSNFAEELRESKALDDIDLKANFTCFELLAGVEAQKILLGLDDASCFSQGKLDLLLVGEIIDNKIFDSDASKNSYMYYLVDSTNKLLSQPLAKRQIKAVADALIEHKTLTGKQVAQIMQRCVEEGDTIGN